MTDISKFSKQAFSQPYGPAQLYGPPPYAYRNARSITTVFTAADRVGIEQFLPPGWRLLTPEPWCSRRSATIPSLARSIQ